MISLRATEYPHGTRARYNATKCRCFRCRRANAAYEQQRQRRVPADRARAHLVALVEQGIGLRSIADATDIARTQLKKIATGVRTKIDPSVEEKILDVDASVIADHALVPAAATRRLLRELICQGYTKTRLAAQLGSQAKVPALQYKHDHVLAKTAMRVRQLHERLLAEADDAPAQDSGPRARILSAIAWFDAVTAAELFDAMDIDDDERGAYTQAIHRLAEAGELERLGTKPFRYRRVA